MSVVDLINYLRLKGPHDQEHIPTASEEDALPPGDEFTDEEGDFKDERDASAEAGSVEREDHEEDPIEEEPMEKEDPEEDPSEEEPIEEEGPEEDINEEERMEEEDLSLIHI